MALHFPTLSTAILFTFMAAFPVLVSGCASSQANMWPIYFQDTVTDETGAEAQRQEILYPFIETRRSETRRYSVLRPFLNYEKLPEEGERRVQFLWPLGLVSLREERGELYRFWPVFQHSRTHDFFSDDSTTHGWVFPVIFWGETPEQGAYGGVLPVAGTTHGLLGDEFSWVLFPLYSYYRQGAYRRRDVLWPFFSRGGTPDGVKSTWRAWPLHVRKDKEGAYEHRYWLWPFLRRGSQRWETVAGRARSSDYFAFHPFYSRRTTRDEDGETIDLQRQLFLYNRRHDRRWEQDQAHWALFFSLIRRENTDEVDEWRFFPLFWKKTSHASGSEDGRGVVHHRLAWPLIWRTLDASLPDRERLYAVFAPFLWHYRTHYIEKDAVRRSTTFWPVVTVERAPDGGLGLYVLSHGWRDGAGGYKRNYRPFFEFFRFHADSDGGRETRLLWRLYHHKRSAEGRRLSVPFLFSYESELDDGDVEQRTFSFLLGLLQYEAGGEGGRLNVFNLF